LFYFINNRNFLLSEFSNLFFIYNQFDIQFLYLQEMRPVVQ